jgi:hypothetical protein
MKTVGGLYHSDVGELHTRSGRGPRLELRRDDGGQGGDRQGYRSDEGRRQPIGEGRSRQRSTGLKMRG